MLGLCFISGIDSRKLMMSFAGELRKSVQLGTSCNAECQHIADRLLARDAALVPLRSASTWRAYRGRNASSCSIESANGRPLLDVAYVNDTREPHDLHARTVPSHPAPPCSSQGYSGHSSRGTSTRRPSAFARVRGRVSASAAVGGGSSSSESVAGMARPRTPPRLVALLGGVPGRRSIASKSSL